jgi:aspartate carbamoyltransferase catalytic subunit
MRLIGMREMDVDQIEHLIAFSLRLKAACKNGGELPSLHGKSVGMLFLEDSTRTRVGFEQAALRLGLHTTSFGMQGSSMSKGESLKDTVLTLKSEGIDGLVMRHKCSGAAMLAADLFEGPVINAGDGMHEHPTQALADAMTIIENRDSVAGLVVAIVGDALHSRVARSNIWSLTKLGAEVRLVGPKTLLPKFPAGLPVEICHDLHSGIQGADVVMALRLQKERMTSGLISSTGEFASLYQINSRALRFAKPDCIVMHPGPINRGIEIDDATADGSQSVITQQVENGVYVRMAAFAYVFGLNGEQRKSKARSRAS